MKTARILILASALVVPGTTVLASTWGRVEVVTSTGTVHVMTGSDTLELLGRRPDTKDLVKIVQRRNRKMKGEPEVSHHHDPSRGEYKVMLAASLLGEVREPEAFTAVLALADDPYFLVRSYAVQALQSYGDSRALPTLLRLLRTRRPCNGALEPAIGQLGDATAVPDLIERIPAGGSMEADACLRAIETITGLSLAAVRDEWGLVYYGKRHQDFLSFMRNWWEQNKDQTRSGRRAEQDESTVPSDAAPSASSAVR